MSNAELKQKLKEYIETSDEKLLKLMYAVAKEYHEDDSQLEDAEIQMLEERREEYLAGKSKGYTWQETKEMIINRKNPG
jgi:cob(I)alamin adenosyltransferase